MTNPIATPVAAFITFRFVASDSPGGKFSLRILRRTVAGSWKQIPAAKAILVHQGVEAMPELANQAVDIALAYVELVDRVPFRLHRLTREEWRFGPDGKIDEDAQMRKIHVHFNAPLDQAEKAAQFSIDELAAIHKVLGIR